MKVRFVGGPLHGEIRAVDDRSRYVEMYSQPVPAWGGTKDYWEGPKRTRYERRPLGFSMYATVYVYALEGMGEAEFMRRCADIIEGV